MFFIPKIELASPKNSTDPKQELDPYFLSQKKKKKGGKSIIPREIPIQRHYTGEYHT
jgi:hypothetical protein